MTAYKISGGSVRGLGGAKLSAASYAPPPNPKKGTRYTFCHRRGIEILSPDIIFSRCRLTGVMQTWVLPNRKESTALLPARLFLSMPPLEHVSFSKGPAPEGGTPRVSGEPSRRKGSAHTSPEGRGLRPPARGAPPRRVRGVSCLGAINLAEIRYCLLYTSPSPRD